MYKGIRLRKDGPLPMFYEIRVWDEHEVFVVMAEWGRVGHSAQMHKILFRGADSEPFVRTLLKRLKKKKYEVEFEEE
jgi:hypothetical protein